MIEGCGGGKTCRAASHDSHTKSIAQGMLDSHISFQEGSLGNGTFILAIGDSLARHMIEHTSLLAESRTDATRELWKGVGLLQQLICRFPFAAIERVVPFGVFVAKRASPVAEGHAAIHATAGLFLPVAHVERLFHFAEVVYAVVNRSVSSLFARHGQKCFRISHFNLLFENLLFTI